MSFQCGKINGSYTSNISKPYPSCTFLIFNVNVSCTMRLFVSKRIIVASFSCSLRPVVDTPLSPIYVKEEVDTERWRQKHYRDWSPEKSHDHCYYFGHESSCRPPSMSTMLIFSTCYFSLWFCFHLFSIKNKAGNKTTDRFCMHK